MARKRIRDELRALRDALPGNRFQGGHDRHRVANRAIRFTLIVVGIGISLAGALTFWIPGPNFLVVLVGLAIVAAQWGFVARELDRLEVAARRWNQEAWHPYRHKRPVIVAAWLLFFSLVAVVGWLAWRHGWLPGWLPLVD